MAAQTSPASSKDEVARQLERCSVRIRQSVPASTLTTFGIGGPIRYVIEADDTETLSSALKVLGDHGEPYRVLGAGSNLLVTDTGIEDWVIKLGKGLRRYHEKEDGVLEVGAAMPLMTLSREVSARGLSGLEFAGGIPASVGGAVFMNAGAHGGDMSNCIESIELVLPSGEIAKISSDTLVFSYRRTELPTGAIVTGAQLRLVESDPVVVERRRAEFLAERKKNQPLTLPSAGSVFKNPSPSRTAGVLIEEAGIRGHRIGGAIISPMHGNWIVNDTKNARERDVVQLISFCQRTIHDCHGIDLEPELVRWA